MASIACTTWNGGGNVAVFRALAEELRASGHDVAIQVDWGEPPLLDGDVLLVDHMTPLQGLEAAIATGKPVATVVHTLWSFVPFLEGTFAPPRYLDLLSRVDANLVFSIPELDAVEDPPDNMIHVGPVFGAPTGAGHEPSRDAPFVVVSLGTTDLGETDALQRVLDGLGDQRVEVLATAGAHIDITELRVPDNTTITGFVSHSLVLPTADVFVGHGGHGGIMASLASATPIAAIPLDRDQPHNAARVVRAGAGRSIARDADPEQIAAAVNDLLNDEKPRAVVARFANAIRARRGEPTAAVESLLNSN